MSMNRWEEKVREIAERVADMELDSEEKYASAFYREITKEITVEEYPDEVKKVVGIVGRPRLVAFKHLDEAYEDAWGNKIKIDSELVAVANLVGMSGGEGVWEFPITEEEARGRKYRFIAITPKEHEEVLKEMEKYIYTDTKDAKDTPMVFAVVPMGMKEDSPSPRWNELAEKMEIKRVKTMINDAYEYVRRRIYEELKIDGEPAINVFLREVVGADGELELIKGDVEQVLKDDNAPLIIERIRFPNGKHVDMRDLETMIEVYMNYKENIDAYLKEMEKLEYLREHGGAEDIEVGIIINRRTRRAYYLMMDNWKLKVPRNLVGIVVGRGGANIKKIEELLKHRVEIVKTEPHDLGDGYKVLMLTGDMDMDKEVMEVIDAGKRLKEIAGKEAVASQKRKREKNREINIGF